MRLNVYTEELLTINDNQPMAEIVTAEYVSSRTGQPMKNFGLRIYLRSHPALHYIPGRDDDRSAVTFWVGSKAKNLLSFIEVLKECAEPATLREWREKTVHVQQETEKAYGLAEVDE